MRRSADEAARDGRRARVASYQEEARLAMHRSAARAFLAAALMLLAVGVTTLVVRNVEAHVVAFPLGLALLGMSVLEYRAVVRLERHTGRR